MSVQAEYEFYVDWDNDGNYNNAYSDISSYFLSAVWELGTPSFPPARTKAGRLEIVLNNSTSVFSSEYSSGPIYGKHDPGIRVKGLMRIDQESADVFVFNGVLRGIDTKAGEIKGDNTASLVALGILSKAKKAGAFAALQETKTTGWLLEYLLEAVGIGSAYRNIETGDATITKWWKEKDKDDYDALFELVETELGRLYETPDGIVNFYDRGHYFTAPNDSPASTFGTGTLRMWDLQYDKPLDTIYNIVESNVRNFNKSESRILVTGINVDGGLGGAPALIGPGEYIDYIFEFPNEDSPSGCIGVHTWGTLDLEANTQADNQGTDITSDIATSTTDYGFRRVIRLTNNFSDDAYITLIRQNGIAIVEDSPEPLRSEDSAANLAKYGYRYYPAKPKWVTNREDGQELIDFIRDQYKTTRGVVSFRLVANTDNNHLTEVQSMSPGRRIRVVASEATWGFGLDKNFIVDYTKHVLTRRHGKYYHNCFVRATEVPSSQLGSHSTAYTEKEIDKTQLSPYSHPFYISSADPFTEESNGDISWTAMTIEYGGSQYTVGSGSTSNVWIYWDPASPTSLGSSSSIPADDKIIVGYNNLGTFIRLWRAGDVLNAPGTDLDETIVERRYNTLRGQSIWSEDFSEGQAIEGQYTWNVANDNDPTYPSNGVRGSNTIYALGCLDFGGYVNYLPIDPDALYRFQWRWRIHVIDDAAKDGIGIGFTCYNQSEVEVDWLDILTHSVADSVWELDTWYTETVWIKGLGTGGAGTVLNPYKWPTNSVGDTALVAPDMWLFWPASSINEGEIDFLELIKFDDAASDAAQALIDAATAQTAADDAQTDADAANALLTDIAADNKFTPVEKQAVRKEWDIIAAEVSVIDAQADTYGITTEKTTYDNAFQALADYLNNGTSWVSGIPTWISDANLSTTTNITGSTFRSKFKDYYDARTALLDKVADLASRVLDGLNSDGTVADDMVERGALSVSALLEARYEALGGQGYLYEDYEQGSDREEQWNIDPSSENSCTYPTNGYRGGKVLHMEGFYGEWMANRIFPFDPDALYRFQWRVRRTASPDSAGHGYGAYLYTQDNSKVDTSPASINIVDEDITDLTLNAWDLQTVWFKGTGTGGSGTATDPYKLPTDAAYFGFGHWFNYAGPNSNEAEIDFIEIVAFDEDAQYRVYAALAADGLLNTEPLTQAKYGAMGALYSFQETWEAGDDALDNYWIWKYGGTATIVTSSGVKGGNVLQILNHRCNYSFGDYIPFDPDLIYYTQIRVRRTDSDGTTTERKCQPIFYPFDKDKGSLTAVWGYAVDLNNYSQDEWVVGECWWSGIGTSGSGASPDDPKKLPTGTAYIAPGFVLNYDNNTNQDNSAQLDSITVIAFDPNVALRVYLGLDSDGLLTTNPLVQTRYGTFRASGMFTEDFEDEDALKDSGAWELTSYSGTYSYPKNGEVGGKVFRATGYTYWVSAPDHMFTFDPEALYRFTYKVRRISSTPETGQHKAYLRAKFYDKDGSALSSPGYQDIVWRDLEGDTADEWQTIVKWVKGFGTGSSGTDPTDPINFDTDTAYFKLTVALNYNDYTAPFQNISEIDLIQIEKFDADGQARLYAALDSAGLLNDDPLEQINYNSVQGRTLLIESFETTNCLNYWTAYSPATYDGTATRQTGGQAGQYVIEAEGEVARRLITLIPYNENWLYKISAKVRRTYTDDDTEDNVRLGFHCVDSSQSSLGASTVQCVDLTALSLNTWFDTQAWFSGRSASPSGGSFPTDPYEMPLTTAYVRPIFYLNHPNYPSGLNKAEIDCIRVEVYDEDGQVRLYTAIASDGSVNQSALSLANKDWVQSCVFSVTDADTVAWASGTLRIGDTSYSISGDDTGNMTARTYIYFDSDVSTTAYQTTTTMTTAIGANKRLIAIAQNATGSAQFATLDGTGRKILASEIYTVDLAALSADLGTITAGTVTGALIQSDSGSTVGTKMDTDGVRGYDASNNLTFDLDASDGSLWLAEGMTVFDVGDPASPHFTKSSFSFDTNFHNVSISSYVPSDCHLVGIRCDIVVPTASVSTRMELHRYNQSNSYNMWNIEMYTTNRDLTCLCFCDSQYFRYRFSSASSYYTTTNLTIRFGLK